MKTADKKNQHRLIIDKAERSIKAAVRNIEEGDFDFGSSRAYYAAFYAMESVLLTQNLSFSKHAGAISAFNQHFIKNDIFPKEFSKLISRLFRERQIGDYDFSNLISKEDAECDVDVAKKIVSAIKEYLVKNGCL